MDLVPLNSRVSCSEVLLVFLCFYTSAQTQGLHVQGKWPSTELRMPRL